MSEGQYDNSGTILNLKRVRKAVDSKGREQVVATFGLTTDRQGNEINTADQLIDALTPYRGKQVNFDLRITQKETANGKTFDTGFVIVKEMIPKDDPRNNQGKAKFVPKGASKQAEIAKNAERVRQAIKG